MNKERYKKHPTLDIEVSNFGNVRTIDRTILTKRGYMKYPGRQLTKVPQTTKKSKTMYEKVGISSEPMNYKHFWVHRLVAQTWLENPEKLKYVNHKDGNGLNNCVDNLEWCDNSYNVRDAIKRGHYKNIHYINGKCLSEISRELGGAWNLVRKRLQKGWCEKCATTIPKIEVGKRRKNVQCENCK